MRWSASWWRPIPFTGKATAPVTTEKVAALRRVWDIARTNRDRKHEIEEDLLGVGEEDLLQGTTFTRTNPAEAKRLQDYLWEKDREGAGYRVVETTPDAWQVADADGKALTGATVHDNEPAAWADAHPGQAAAYTTPATTPPSNE
mgnify:CR=1 FL=1